MIHGQGAFESMRPDDKQTKISHLVNPWNEMTSRRTDVHKLLQGLSQRDPTRKQQDFFELMVMSR